MRMIRSIDPVGLELNHGDGTHHHLILAVAPFQPCVRMHTRSSDAYLRIGLMHLHKIYHMVQTEGLALLSVARRHNQ